MKFTTPDFLLPGLISSVGHLCGDSYLTFQGLNIYPVNYMSLLARPCTGKSAVINFIMEALVKVESYGEISSNNSRICTSVSFDKILINHKNAIRKFCKR